MTTILNESDPTVEELFLAYQKAMAETEEAVRAAREARLRENAAYRAWRAAVNK